MSEHQLDEVEEVITEPDSVNKNKIPLEVIESKKKTIGDVEAETIQIQALLNQIDNYKQLKNNSIGN